MGELKKFLKEDGSIARLASRFLRDERGATAIEYSLIVALMGTVIILGLGAVGTSLRDDVFGNISSTLDDAASK